MTTRAILYVRQSLDRQAGTDAEGAAVARQEEAGRALCEQRGWTVVGVITENGVSASTGRRPGFERLLQLVDARAVDVVVVWHVDRLVRKITELEDVIDRCTTAGVRLATVTGDLDLGTDAGRLVGRILAAVARGEVERKGARQRMANRQAAEQGKVWAFGHRPFGFEEDKVTHRPAEAAVIRRAYDTLLAGGTLRGLAREWNAQGVATPQEAARGWIGETVRRVLANPRNAGLRTYRGEIIGPAEWDPIVPEDTFRAVRAILDDPSRRSLPTGHTLLGGLVRCGPCGGPAFGARSTHGHRLYRCRDRARGHVASRAEPIDALVTSLIVGRLAMPDAVELTRSTRQGPDVDALRGEAQTLRARLDEIAAEFADGSIPARMVHQMTDRVTARLAEVELQLSDASRLSVLSPLVTADDVRDAWQGLDVDRQRAVIDMLVGITLYRPGQGVRAFDPETVKVTWKV